MVLLWAEQSSWLVLLFRNVPGEGLSLHSSFFFLLFFCFYGFVRLDQRELGAAAVPQEQRFPH